LTEACSTAIGGRAAVLDGEVIVLDRHNRPNFDVRSNLARIRDITGLPLSPRRAAYKRNQTPTGRRLTRKIHLRRAVVHCRVEVRCVMPPAELGQSGGAVVFPLNWDVRKAADE
jgi:hypothetical protein